MKANSRSSLDSGLAGMMKNLIGENADRVFKAASIPHPVQRYALERLDALGSIQAAVRDLEPLHLSRTHITTLIQFRKTGMHAFRDDGQTSIDDSVKFSEVSYQAIADFHKVMALNQELQGSISKFETTHGFSIEALQRSIAEAQLHG